MSSIVFILGAGASKDAGAPLMSNFLDVAERLLRTGAVREAKNSFEAVFHGRSYLARAHSKSQLEIRNVEEVFAAFELARILGRLGDYTEDQIEFLANGMNTVIVKTLEQSINFYGSDGTIVPTPYASFCNMLTTIRETSVPKQSVSVITFNYDLVLDYAFFRAGLAPTYGFETEKEEAELQNAVPLLKLHGSLNWGQCSKCGEVFPWRLEEYLYGSNPFQGRRDPPGMFLSVGSRIGELEHRDGRADTAPVLVPPTWNKGEHYRALSRVWARAAKELSEAESIFVIGYSLPDSDVFFRHLYALGTISDRVLKRFVVYDPAPEVAEKFRKMLGPGSIQAFDYAGDGVRDFANGIEDIYRRLGSF